jgi:hypothetical protein
MSAKLKMYNVGDRIKEPISFSIPDTYGDVHAIARWELDAPAQSFFYAPTELKLGFTNLDARYQIAVRVLTPRPAAYTGDGFSLRNADEFAFEMCSFFFGIHTVTMSELYSDKLRHN